jgi:tRNA-splicing endonuclease subunit Sen2
MTLLHKYKYPLPIQIATFIPHNPLSWLLVVYLCYRTSPIAKAEYLQELKLVSVEDPEYMRDFWRMGFFGRGSLSRSEPTWEKRLQGNTTSEEVTKKRRMARKAFKRARAEKEKLELLKILEQEGAKVQLTIDEAKVEVTTLPKSHLDAKESLHLLPVEAFFLSNLGVLDVYIGGKQLSASELQAQFIADCPRFNTFYAVYHYFRSQGWVVRSGIKFGVDYILYKRGPPFSHAAFSILILTDTNPTIDWYKFFTTSRIQSQVHKTLVIVHVSIPASGLLSDYTVQETTIQRWTIGRNR